MLFLIRLFGLAVGHLSRLLRLGGGTSLPGKLALKMRPNIVQEMSEGLCVVLISATNGKTTTSNLLADILKEAKYQVVANSEGANLMSGICTALLKQKRGSRKRGQKKGQAEKGVAFGIFEVDEAILPEATANLNPHLIILGNLFRDQLDRYGELEKLTSIWHELVNNQISQHTKILANADDPLVVASLGDLNSKNIFFYGLDDFNIDRKTQSESLDVTHCRKCGSDMSYEFYSIGHLGGWSCEAKCGWIRPTLNFLAKNIILNEIQGSQLTVAPVASEFTLNEAAFDITSIDITTPLPGLHNIYNITAASAAAFLLQVEPAHITAALLNASRQFGRFEEIEIENKKMILMLTKNSTSVNENLATLIGKNKAGKFHFLSILNDKIADGTDISWIWDVDYEQVVPNIKFLTAGGTRGSELALRLQYAGLPVEQIEVADTLKSALNVSLKKLEEAKLEESDTNCLIVLLTYTALLEFRKLLHKQRIVKPYWKK